MKTIVKSVIYGMLGAALLAGLLAGPTWGQAQNPRPALPGAINYVEGQVSADGQTLSQNSVGSVVLQAGQPLSTQTGKVEILLTPGVFFRVNNNSNVRMISPDLANTSMEVDRGQAMVEVDDISKNNNISIRVGGSNTTLLKKGLYEFDADRGEVRVFKGKADVQLAAKKVSLGDHHQVMVNAEGKVKGKDFDTKQYADEFYRWSGLRSGYLAEADADEARLYLNGGVGWVGSGWYWDPWFDGYTFIPGAGIFYSPFGWGFYSPFEIWGSPFFYGGYYGRAHHFGDFHGPYGHGFEPRGGFHGMGGGGFHGGGGGGGHR